MPRLRGGGYRSQIIPRYQQRVKEVDDALKRIFLYGASTRLTGEALRPILGEAVSAQTISNIAKSLDKEVKRYHNRTIEDVYLYLFLDGIVLKTKTGFGAKKKVILVAYGVTYSIKFNDTNIFFVLPTLSQNCLQNRYILQIDSKLQRSWYHYDFYYLTSY